MLDIDVTIPAGQQVAIVGATGSGKTTLGRLIARFADPTIGTIGSAACRSNVVNAELRRRLVVVSQEPFLFDDTIAANVGFAVRALDAGRHRARRRASSTSATGSKRCPTGLDDRGRRARRSVVGR